VDVNVADVLPVEERVTPSDAVRDELADIDSVIEGVAEEQSVDEKEADTLESCDAD